MVKYYELELGYDAAEKIAERKVNVIEFMKYGHSYYDVTDQHINLDYK